jgi:hypothetical protein
MHPSKRTALLKVLAQMGELEFLPDEIEPADVRPVFTRPRDLFRSYAASLASRYGRADPIPFLYLHQSHLNACAFRCDGHGFVGINWGCVILLQDLFPG